MKCDKPLNKYDLIRIEMVCEYWFDEEPWSDAKNEYFKTLVEQMDSKDNKETGAESSADKTSSSQISKDL